MKICIGFQHRTEESIRLKKSNDPRPRGRITPRREGGGLQHRVCVRKCFSCLGRSPTHCLQLGEV
jgi:hypothetical protein